MENNKTILVLSVLAGVIIAGSGGFLLGQKSVNVSSLKQPAAVVKTGEPTMAPPKRNKVVKSISQTVAGKVKSVGTDKIILSDGGDDLEIAVTKDTVIEKVTVPSPPERKSGESAPPPPPPSKEKITLRQIMAGDNLAAMLVSVSGGNDDFIARTIAVSGK